MHECVVRIILLVITYITIYSLIFLYNCVWGTYYDLERVVDNFLQLNFTSGKGKYQQEPQTKEFLKYQTTGRIWCGDMNCISASKATSKGPFSPPKVCHSQCFWRIQKENEIPEKRKQNMEHKIFIIKFGRNKVYPINQNKYGMKKYS